MSEEHVGEGIKGGTETLGEFRVEKAGVGRNGCAQARELNESFASVYRYEAKKDRGTYSCECLL